MKFKLATVALLIVAWMLPIVFIVAVVKQHPRLTMTLALAHGDRIEYRGWKPEGVEHAAGWRASLPPFRIVDASGNAVDQDNARMNVRLYELQRMANGAEPVNGPQLTGDCTSWAFEHACEITLAAQQIAGGKSGYARVFPTFSYAVGRVEVWKPKIVGRMPSEGCTVAAVCEGAQRRGFLSWHEAAKAGFKYSGQLADHWGQTGPPASLYAVAAQHKVQSFGKLSSADDVRDAICNGYGVAFGSDFTWQKYKTVDGRIVAIDCTAQTAQDARCGHAMCCDAYDGEAPHGPWFHIQNSWYPNSHPDPIDGSPVCGFWVDHKVMSYIAGKNDCFAIPSTDGFTSRDTQLFRARPKVVGPSKVVIAF